MYAIISLTITVVSMYTAYGLRRNDLVFSKKLIFLAIFSAISTIAWSFYILTTESYNGDSPWTLSPVFGSGLLVTQVLRYHLKTFRKIRETEAQKPNYPRNALKVTIVFVYLLMCLVVINLVLTGNVIIQNIFS